MKKNYFFIFILTMSFSVISFAQTQPTVHNSTFDKIAKAEGSDCSCAGWINKSLADQGESSTTDGNDVVKLDNVESDGVYQEVAVEANSDYTIDLDVKWSSTDTTTEYLEIVVLKGSGYVADYTPAYAGPAEAAQDDFGYRTVESADLASNQLSKSNLTVPGDSEMNAISTISFNTGTETSIAIFIRAVGPYDSGAHGDSGKDKGWMNGDTELRIDNFSLVNLGESSTTSNLFIAETFDYDDATPLVSTEGWANFSGTEGQILVNSGEIQLKDTDSEDADTIFPDGSVTGDVYYAFDITVTKPASVSGSDFEYFALLRPVGSTSYKARLDVAEFTETGFKFGIHSSSSTAEVLWGSELSYTETHRIVVRYSTTVGDTQLWVNASDDSSSSITTTTTSTVADIGAFAFRQSSSSPDFIHTIDNLAVGSAFDDVLNFPATSTTPSIAITAPTDGATLASTTTSVTVSVSTTDFAVGATDAGLDGHIHWSIQENSDAAVDQAMKYDTNDETISVTSGNTYTVFMELRDNSHQPLSPEVNTSVTFSVEAGSNTVTPLTSATWKGYINTFNISDGAYQFGFEYGVADMQSTITDTYVKLQPNFGIWTAEASNAAWFDSSSGTQTPILNIEGNTFVENNDLAGSDLTFEGNVSAADLDAGYTAVAFIKALDPNNGYATVVNKSIDITSAGDFTVSATAAELVEGFIVQYGFAVTGPPADPATEDSLGSVVMGVEPAGSNTVTPLTSATWKGYINTFNISDGAYQFGFEYGVADMQSTITDTYVKLQPNFGIWTAEASNAAWFDSSSGTQTPILNIEGNTFVENNDLAGSDLTFEGNVSAADLDAGYTAVAFIKALDPNNGYATVVNKSIDITSAGDFTVSATAAELVEGFIVQYGFAVTGPPADPATEDSLGSVVMGVEPAGSNTVTPLTSATWKGYINTFNISDGAYQFGFEYGVADMQSTITDTYVKLQPNFGIWTAEASNAAWFDSSSGTQTPILNIEGNTFVENNDLAGSDLTFEGNVSAADLDAGYTAVAFIKALDPNNGYATVVNKSIDITSAGDFTVSATAAELVEGFIVQYGFAVTGPPADPATEDSLGSVVMGDESTAGIDDQDLITLNMYPNPASDVLNISAQNTINTVEIYNVLGQKVIRMNVEDTSAEINVSNLNAGIYLIKYEINNRTSTKKFVKN